MNMNRSQSQHELSNLLKKNHDFQENAELETYLLAQSFLSEIEKLSIEKKITKKQLALEVGVSASYLSQLYNGNRLPNLNIIVKLGLFFGVLWYTKAKKKGDLVNDNYVETKIKYEHVNLKKKHESKVIKLPHCGYNIKKSAGEEYRTANAF